MNTPAKSLAIALQQARRARRVSQLELSMRVGVSQRHISFVECGRAKPSRELLALWLQALSAPHGLCNAVMQQAGFAPMYQQSKLDDPQLGPINTALDALLQSHDPLPALVLDAHWNLIKLNRGAWALANLLMPEIFENLQSSSKPATQLNMLDLLLHPQGLSRSISNWEELAPGLLLQLQQEAQLVPELAPKVHALAMQLKARNHRTEMLVTTSPVLLSKFTTRIGELAFFSMFTTFGRPYDVTLASLRVEHMFAADAQTRERFERWVSAEA